MDKKAIIVYGFTSTGKTEFCKKFKNALDLDDSEYRFLPQNKTHNKTEKEILNENPQFPNNYFEALENALDKYDWIFVNHNAIEYCIDKSIDYFLVFPSENDKEIYLQRCKNRGDSEKFLTKLEDNFEKDIEKEKKDIYAKKIITLNENEFIYDYFVKMGYIKNEKLLPYHNDIISMVIPVHNSEKHLPKLFSSIKEQTNQNLEILLIDDGSIDKSRELCKKFSKELKSVVNHFIEGCSVSEARNYGIDHATGEYICFVDSDDYLEPTYCERLLETMQNENSDFVMSGLFEIIDNKKTPHHPQKNQTSNRYNADLFLALFNGCWFPVPWNKLYKTAIIKNAGIKFSEYISYDEDTVFNFDYYKHARKISIITDNLYNYCNNPNSLTRQGEINIFTNSFKTIPCRIDTPKELFGENKQAIFISAKKILKAIIQEAQALAKIKTPKSKIIRQFKYRLLIPRVEQTIKYISPIENNYAELRLYTKIFKEEDTALLLSLCKSDNKTPI